MLGFTKNVHPNLHAVDSGICRNDGIVVAGDIQGFLVVRS